MRFNDERGFTLVELMVAILLFSVLSIGFYQVMFSSVTGSTRASDVAEVAEEARLGFNRIIRDTRETTKLVSADDDEYRIWVDFDRDGCVDSGTSFAAVDDEDPLTPACTAAAGPVDYEYLHYAYVAPNITLTALTGPDNGLAEDVDPTAVAVAGTQTETLASSVVQVDSDADGTIDPIFTYVSNFLTFDDDGNGETSFEELDGLEADDDELTGVELDYVSDVNYEFAVSVGGNSRTFYGQAQIRNRRYSDL